MKSNLKPCMKKLNELKTEIRLAAGAGFSVFVSFTRESLVKKFDLIIFL